MLRFLALLRRAFGSANYFQFLGRWLTNESLPLRLDDDEVPRAAAVVEKYLPTQP